MDDRTARMMVVGPAVVPLICMLQGLGLESGSCSEFAVALLEQQLIDSEFQAARCM
jgi:hypothetical protein